MCLDETLFDCQQSTTHTSLLPFGPTAFLPGTGVMGTTSADKYELMSSRFVQRHLALDPQSLVPLIKGVPLLLGHGQAGGANAGPTEWLYQWRGCPRGWRLTRTTQPAITTGVSVLAPPISHTHYQVNPVGGLHQEIQPISRPSNLSRFRSAPMCIVILSVSWTNSSFNGQKTAPYSPRWSISEPEEQGRARSWTFVAGLMLSLAASAMIALIQAANSSCPGAAPPPIRRGRHRAI